MKFLFFFVHPSKFHLFRFTINKLINNGHRVDILIISKDVLEDLVQREGWKYTNIFPKGRKINWLPSKISIIYNLFITILKLLNYVKRTKYDLFITDDLLGIVGKMRKVTTFLFTDDHLSAIPETGILMFFSDYILTPSMTNLGCFENKKIPIYGFKQSAYLHPCVFTPDQNVLDKYNLHKKNYIIIRLVSLKSYHDIGKKGLTNNTIIRIINLLTQQYIIVIISERKLTGILARYQLKIEPIDLLSIVYYSKLLLADSQTMSAEAGYLGVPFIWFSHFYGKVGYLSELINRYKIGIGLSSKEDSKLIEIVQSDFFKTIDEFAQRKKRYEILENTIDLSSFLVWLFENFPSSIEEFKESIELQLRFKCDVVC